MWVTKIIYWNIIQSIMLFKIYLFIYLWLCWVFVSVRGLSLVVASGGHSSSRARASHCRGLSCCGAQAPDAQAQQLWLTGSVAPRHVGSSQTRARTRVPCIGRQILNHCATREAPQSCFFKYSLWKCWMDVFNLSWATLVSFISSAPSSRRCTECTHGAISSERDRN